MLCDYACVSFNGNKIITGSSGGTYSTEKAIYMRYKEGLKNLSIQMNPYNKKKSEPNFLLSCMLIDKNAMCKQVYFVQI